MQVQVAKWGNSLGLRVPKEVAAKVGLSEGSRVEMSTEGSTITISVERPVYALAELLEDTTPENMREAWDWGADVGREVVE
jgi:antitoxin MazE